MRNGGKDPSRRCRIIYLTSKSAFDMATTIKINGVDRTVDVDGEALAVGGARTPPLRARPT